MLDHWTEDYRMTTDDRVAQISWLRELATNIAQNLGDGTAEELVEFAMSEDAACWEIDWPEWFDDHDRNLLTEMVAEAL